MVDRPGDEIVEVEGAHLPERVLVLDERPGQRPGIRVGGDVCRRHAQLDLEPRDGTVELHHAGVVELRPQATDEALAIGQLDRSPGLAQDLEAERMERPNPHGPRPRCPGAPAPYPAARPARRPPAG